MLCVVGYAYFEDACTMLTESNVIDRVCDFLEARCFEIKQRPNECDNGLTLSLVRTVCLRRQAAQLCR